MEELTTIQLSKGTRERLKSMGRKGDTYEDIILRIMGVTDHKVMLEIKSEGRLGPFPGTVSPKTILCN